MPYRKHPPKVGWLIGGKWSKKYINKLEKTGLTLIQYVKKYLMSKGKLRISLPDMMRAKCFRCCNQYDQPGPDKGRVDCEIVGCPLYRYTPYRKLRPDYDWLFDSSHTRRHRDYMTEHPSMTREQYIDMKFGLEEADADEPDEEEDKET
jgi:hypothetical protein